MLTISSPNTDRSLLTLAELRAAAGATDGSQDAVLTPLGNYVAAMITKACNVARAGAIPPTLRLETVSETFRLKSQQSSLVLARRPVVSFTSVIISSSESDTSDYEYDAAAGVLYNISGDDRIVWPIGPTVVVYSAGYATVPDDLKYAAIKFVQGELSNSARDPSLKRLKIEGVSEREWWVPDNPTKDSIVPPDVMDILRRGGYVNEVLS
jgi:hypothetical protein